MNGENQHDVVIVGTGFAGICVAIKLLEAGIRDFVVLERAGSVGGTWRDNCYPGAACDVPSNLYSFSFEQKPNWQRTYGTQAEILDYIQHCAHKYEVLPHIRFNANVVGAEFDQAGAHWKVRCEDGRVFTARALVSGCGAFSKPATPDIPGIDAFKGDILHTARWNPEYSVQGKRVAVIGTGASAIQVVPTIAPDVKHLTLFQRTAAWVLPKDDRPTFGAERWLFDHAPSSQRAVRQSIYWLQEARVPGFTGQLPGLLKIAERFARRYIRSQVSDPELRKALTPKYDIGCKRILLSNDYYAAVTRSNVTLETSGIDHGCPEGLVSKDGRSHEVDTVICATGFMIADDLAPFPIVGAEGQDLNELWAQQGAEAYLGTTIHGFPNFYTVVGPNTGVGHTSMVYMIEAATEYAVQAIRQLVYGGVRILDVRKAAQDRFNAELQDRLAKSVWVTGGCVSWYNTREGKNTSLWPGQTFEYKNRTSHLDLQDYDAA